MPDVFRTVAIAQRNIELQEPYIVINENISPKLYEFLFALQNIEFKDGSYHCYVEYIKAVVNNFLTYWSDIINDCLRDVDRLSHSITKEEILDLMNRSIEIHINKHEEFVKSFLPCESPEEEKLFEKVEDKYELFYKEMKALKKLVDDIERQEELERFIEKYAELGTRRKNEVFEYSHTIMALCLAENLFQTRTSLEEIRNRIKHNLQQVVEERDKVIAKYHEQLYERNKEKMILTRREHRNSVDEAEVEYMIDVTRAKIEEEHSQNNRIQNHLEDEKKYWDERLNEFEKIETCLLQLREELRKTEEYERTFLIMKSPEYRSSRRDCWDSVGDNLKARKALIDEKIVEASKALITFFAIRGQNRIFYQDNIGTYVMDDYGHQVYCFDHKAILKHVNCDGSFREVKGTEKYYFDDFGRYTKDEHGNKEYRCAPCTSTYNLAPNDLMIKTTVDCGHSEKKNPHCKMQLKDPNDVEILPTVEPVDIQRTLTAEVVQYLWDSVGSTLPEALLDTEEIQRKNPIHQLAHSLINNKYFKPESLLKQRKKEAQQYREQILKKRKDKAIELCKAWRSKQIKRAGPEDEDDTPCSHAYDHYLAQQALINTIDEL